MLTGKAVRAASSFSRLPVAKFGQALLCVRTGKAPRRRDVLLLLTGKTACASAQQNSEKCYRPDQWRRSRGRSGAPLLSRAMVACTVGTESSPSTGYQMLSCQLEMNPADRSRVHLAERSPSPVSSCRAPGVLEPMNAESGGTRGLWRGSRRAARPAARRCRVSHTRGDSRSRFREPGSSNLHPSRARDRPRGPNELAFGLIRKCKRALVGTTNAQTPAQINRPVSFCNNLPRHCTHPLQSDNDTRPPVAHRSQKMMARKPR